MGDNVRHLLPIPQGSQRGCGGTLPHERRPLDPPEGFAEGLLALLVALCVPGGIDRVCPCPKALVL
jgi:hypothetical protein